MRTRNTVLPRQTCPVVDVQDRRYFKTLHPGANVLSLKRFSSTCAGILLQGPSITTKITRVFFKYGNQKKSVHVCCDPDDPNCVYVSLQTFTVSHPLNSPKPLDGIGAPNLSYGIYALVVHIRKGEDPCQIRMEAVTLNKLYKVNDDYIERACT